MHEHTTPDDFTPTPATAQVMHPDGCITHHNPKGARWTLREVQALVGGYVENVRIPGDRERTALVDEEGMLKELPLNYGASLMLGQAIVGPAVILPSKFFT